MCGKSFGRGSSLARRSWGRVEARSYDPGRTRTCNPRLRGLMPYPLGHEANGETFAHVVTTRFHACQTIWRVCARRPRARLVCAVGAGARAHCCRWSPLTMAREQHLQCVPCTFTSAMCAMYTQITQ